MGCGSPSYFSRQCTLWVVYVGLRAFLLSLSLEVFCDLLTCNLWPQTRALIVTGVTLSLTVSILLAASVILCILYVH